MVCAHDKRYLRAIQNSSRTERQESSSSGNVGDGFCPVRKHILISKENNVDSAPLWLLIKECFIVPIRLIIRSLSDITTRSVSLKDAFHVVK